MCMSYVVCQSRRSFRVRLNLNILIGSEKKSTLNWLLLKFISLFFRGHFGIGDGIAGATQTVEEPTTDMSIHSNTMKMMEGSLGFILLFAEMKFYFRFFLLSRDLTLLQTFNAFSDLITYIIYVGVVDSYQSITIQ